MQYSIPGIDECRVFQLKQRGHHFDGGSGVLEKLPRRRTYVSWPALTSAMNAFILPLLGGATYSADCGFSHTISYTETPPHSSHCCDYRMIYLQLGATTFSFRHLLKR